MVTPYLTSRQLIETVKRNMNFPQSQQTFSDDDILSFANQEMFGVQVPTIMEVHEDYFTFSSDVQVKPNKSRYDIPERAIGLKLNDVYWTDRQSNFGKMILIQNTERSLYGGPLDGGWNSEYYFIEANQVCLTPNVGADVQNKSLRFVYYLRPNNLVVNERAAICKSFTRDITISNTSLIAGDTITLGSLVLTADTDFAIGVTDLATASNLNSAINTQGDFSSTVTGAVVILKYPEVSMTIITSNTTAISIEQVQGIEFDQVPANITNTSLVDFIKLKGGHRTYKIDVKLGKNVVGPTGIKFPLGVIPEEFEAGDYVCSQFECIIPQIPSDLHNILAERTVARILEALGDTVGLQAANGKIAQLEARQNTMIDSRVYGSPRKVLNRGSLLRRGKNFRIF